MPEADPSLSERDARALVRDGYDAIAERYTELADAVPASHPRRLQTAALLDLLSPNSHVLELGCGGGAPVGATVVDAGHAYLGVDLSPGQIEQARRLVPLGQFSVGDAAEVDYEDESFDAVVMLYAITHVSVDRWSGLFVRIRRWLRPGGWFLINVPLHASPGWLEEDFLGLGTTNWTNSPEPAAAVAMLESAELAVVDAQRPGEDDLDPEGWLWIVAQAH